MDSRYITSAAQPKQLPDLGLPEFALIGRSNSGKSTLLNEIFNHRGLARTGRTPGRTQLIHFFSLDNRLIVADLPGYGFSKISRDIRAIWDELISAYLTREPIMAFLFLIDIRRDFQPEDISLLQQLEDHRPVMIILTKADKVNQSQAQKKVNQTRRDCSSLSNIKDIVAVSSLKKKGVEKLREKMLEIATTDEMTEG